jgi:hypothetical protein
VRHSSLTRHLRGNINAGKTALRRCTFIHFEQVRFLAFMVIWMLLLIRRRPSHLMAGLFSFYNGVLVLIINGPRPPKVIVEVNDPSKYDAREYA